MVKITCFKAYDVRGRVPEKLEDLAYRIGRAYAAFLSPARVAVGRDIRASSLPLAAALTEGLNEAGVDVWDVGLCSAFDKVIDTNVVVSGLNFGGNPKAVLELVRKNHLQNITSPFILNVEKVLTRRFG
jgi:hypothetical protein